MTLNVIVVKLLTSVVLKKLFKYEFCTDYYGTLGKL